MELRQGDALEVMRGLEPCSVDAVVTDPPYGLGFMGKEWDKPGASFVERKAAKGNRFDHVGGNHNPINFQDAARTRRVEGQRFQAWAMEWAGEVLRVAKPGAHLLAFGGTRTFHRLACAIEDAGWEVRDCLSWLYGSGFPKSLDVSKAIDRAAGAEREVVGHYQSPENTTGWKGQNSRGVSYVGTAIPDGELRPISAPATNAAREWQGWGTALKPAWEPIILARKPLVGTVAANVLEHGTGALNVDGCRIGTSPADARAMERVNTPGSGRYRAGKFGAAGPDGFGAQTEPFDCGRGRWPANLVLDEAAAAMLDEQSGDLSTHPGTMRTLSGGGGYSKLPGRPPGTVLSTGDTGGASRFFYTAKASSGERHYAGKNSHPTVKPVDLMRWLVRLVTPPGGLILDPFMGSGSTGVAALAEGFRFLGIELDPEMVKLARRRILGPLFAETVSRSTQVGLDA